MGRYAGVQAYKLFLNPEDWVAALSCCPFTVIAMHPLTRNPNYSSMQPCECMDLCCIWEKERVGRERKDDERLGLKHVSKFGMSSDQRTAMEEKERKRRRGRRYQGNKAPEFSAPFSIFLLCLHFSPFKLPAPYFNSTPTLGQILKMHIFLPFVLALLPLQDWISLEKRVEKAKNAGVVFLNWHMLLCEEHKSTCTDFLRLFHKLFSNLKHPTNRVWLNNSWESEQIYPQKQPG